LGFQLYDKTELDNAKVIKSMAFVFSNTLNAATNHIRVAVQKAMDDKSPKLDGFVDQSMFWIEQGTTNTIVILQMSVNNSGASPSIAEHYKLSVTLTNDTTLEAEPMDIGEQYNWNSLSSNTLTIYKLKRSDLISEKTSIAIQPGSEARGWLAYRLTNATLNIQPKTPFPFVVSFLDVNGKIVSATNGFWKGNVVTNYESLEHPLELPGSGNLVLTNIQLPTAIDVVNWQPPELEPGCTNVTIVFGNIVFNIPRWQAEVSPGNTPYKIPISNLPESIIRNLEKMPNYSPRLESIFVKGSGSMQTAFGDKPVTYPFWPFVASNRLYLYVQMPFLSGMKKLIMNDSFDTSLPNPWDRNYGTNQYVYEIVNENTNPVLQVFYTRPSEIHINGIFIVSSNSALQAFWDAPKLFDMSYKIIDLDANQETANVSIPGRMVRPADTNSIGEVLTNALYDMMTSTNQSTIFKYPSNRKNIGVFANSVYAPQRSLIRRSGVVNSTPTQNRSTL